MKHDQIIPDTDLSKYVGQWIVVCGNKVVAHDKDLTKLSKEIKDCKTSPTIAKIPKKDILIF